MANKFSKPAILAELERQALEHTGFEPKEEWNGLNLIARDQYVGFLAGALAAIALMLEREKVLREAITCPFSLENCGKCAKCKTLARVPEWKNV